MPAYYDVRNGLTREEEFQVRRLRFDDPLERIYRHDATEENRPRLRAVFALTYLLSIATSLQLVLHDRESAAVAHAQAGHSRQIQDITLFVVMQLLLPIIPFVATFFRGLMRSVMTLTALDWCVILGFSLHYGVTKENATADLFRQGMVQVLVATGAVVLVRMPAYLVAFCCYTLFAGYVWEGRLHNVMGVETGLIVDRALPTGSIVLFVGLTLLVVGAYLTETIQRRSFLLRRLLAQERARSEALISNMLPKSISERLRTNPNVIAEHHRDVTVMFADLVNFTPYAAARSPGEVVRHLNEVFSRFDQLVESFGVEKIKTIGDSYMVGAGLPKYRKDHLEVSLDLALEMLRASADMNVELRIGLHCGRVMAGVIGTKKYMYDLWGDTVNVASRMESFGVPGRVQVSEAVVDRMSELFQFEERGVMDVKGIGRVNTFLLVGRRDLSRAVVCTESATLEAVE